jgi:D-aminoacyl-tRNA deacylase
MRALVQRVTEASVTVEGVVIGQIGLGLLIFLGVKDGDTERESLHLATKVVHLRVFSDAQGKMNLNVGEIGGSLLIVSQFTLYGNTSKGNRPSYSEAARPETAKRLYEVFIDACKKFGIEVSAGIFQAHMDVHLINSGPVTLMCTSER